MCPQTPTEVGQFRVPAGARAAVLLAVALLPGCDSIFGSDPEPTTITVTPASVSIDALGGTVSLSVEVLDQDDQVMEDVTVSWSSSSPQVVSVSETGLVTSVGNGTAEITATAGSAMGSASATVNQVATGLDLVGGDQQTGVVGAALGQPLVVQARDRLGATVGGAGVRFSVVQDGDGTVDPDVVDTGPDGRASAAWVLGTRAGAIQRAEARLEVNPGRRVVFTAAGTPGPPHDLVMIGGDGQTGLPGQVLSERLEVQVEDEFGNLVPEVTVSFEAGAGSGSVAPSAQASNQVGRASTQWTLGPDEGTHTVTAGIAAGASVTFTATADATPPPPPEPRFDIELVYLNQPTAGQEQAFENARERWESLVTGDLASVDMDEPGGHCGNGTPAINQTVDDVLIYVILEFIDGPGGVLGSAGPCWIRTSNSLPIVGRMRFDTADLNNLEAQGRLEAVILHEMGHVLGIGTLWNAMGFLKNRSLPDNQGADTHFDGPQAIAAFDDIGGDSYTGGQKVPVENELGGSGTRDSHWRQTDIFGNELMTGFLSPGPNPLSVVTVASLADLGYEVDLGGADPFSVDVSLRIPVAGEPLHLRDDLYDGPIRIVDEDGNFVGFFRR